MGFQEERKKEKEKEKERSTMVILQPSLVFFHSVLYF